MNNVKCGIGLGEQSIRFFTQEGQNKYAEEVDRLLSDGDDSKLTDRISTELLTGDKFTEPIESDAKINLDEFISDCTSQKIPLRGQGSKKAYSTDVYPPEVTHFEFQEYLAKILKNTKFSFEEELKVCEWLIAYCFPFFINHKRGLLSREKYSLNLKGKSVFSTLYRHFLFGPYKIYSNYREKSRFILAEVTYIWGNRMEGFNARPEICLGNEKDAVIDVINLVFKDTIEKGKQDIRKFTKIYGKKENLCIGLDPFLVALQKRLNGLAIKNDFQNMNGEELYEILPPYFKGDDSKTPEEYYKENKNIIDIS